MTSILIEKYNPIRILLVEDDKDDRFFFADSLKDLALSVELIITSGGEEAIEYLCDTENPKPNIIFLDLNMPKMNGIECLTYIRKETAHKEIPCIILSTSIAANDINESYKNGANLYFEKPFSYDKLQAIIDKLVRLDWQQYSPPAREMFVTLDN